MMEILNAKTGLARKAKTITGAFMALSAAAVVAMAPSSQAFAATDGGYQTMKSDGGVRITFTGHGRTQQRAASWASKNADCKRLYPNTDTYKRFWGKTRSMYNRTWWNVEFVVICDMIA